MVCRALASALISLRCLAFLLTRYEICFTYAYMV
jgi:hypothetical protein